MEYATLDEYYTIAKKTISAFGYRYYPSLVKEMLNNSDTVSTVAHAIMVADWKWDENRVGNKSGKKKTLYSFRNQCALWAIQKYVTNKYKSNQKYEKHIEHIVKNHDIKYDEDPAAILEYNDNESILKQDINLLINGTPMTDKQREQLRMYYYDNKTLAEIGHKFGVSKEAVRLNIKKAIENIREVLKV